MQSKCSTLSYILTHTFFFAFCLIISILNHYSTSKNPSFTHKKPTISSASPWFSQLRVSRCQKIYWEWLTLRATIQILFPIRLIPADWVDLTITSSLFGGNQHCLTALVISKVGFLKLSLKTIFIGQFPRLRLHPLAQVTITWEPVFQIP